ncbi:MAG: hypothetical protein RI885_2389 [Actinomycetota bacterium]|jgi:transposase-like protein
MSPFLSDRSRAALARLSAGDDAESVPDPLHRLRDIRSVSTALDGDRATLDAVRDALDAGRTWSDIAESSGLGLSAAKWRWQGTDDEIAARHAAGRARSFRPSSVPTDLPGLSVAETATRLGVTPQAVYQRITRGLLTATTVELPDGRRYKRVLDVAAPADTSD